MKRIPTVNLPKVLPDQLRPALEIRDLELVLALASAGSTAAAAVTLHITQSAVSRALAQAEERVGLQLFERGARGLSPSAAGLRLIEGAGAVLQSLRELERRVAAKERAPLRVRLVCECYTAYRWLPSALLAARERWSGFELDVASEHTGDAAEALVRGKIDIALLTTGDLPKGHGLRQEPLFSDEVVFVMAPHHPLARQRVISAQQLLGEQLISGNTPPAAARWFLRAAFGRRKPKLKMLNFPLTEAILDAARAGMGIAVLSEWMADGYVERGDLVVRRLASGTLQRPWRIAYREELAGVAECLKNVLVASAPHFGKAAPRRASRPITT